MNLEREKLMKLDIISEAKKIPVLDHGYVQYIDHMGSDADIVEAARMSTGRGFVSWEPYWRCEKCECIVHEPLEGVRFCPKGCAEGTMKKLPRGDLGLLETLYRDRHTTPIEFGVLHIEVQAPLMVFREWHRHRTQSYSEASARYTQMPNEHYVPALDRFEPKQTGNKQADSKEYADFREDDAELFRTGTQNQQEGVYAFYEAMLKGGVPKEVARINTPVSRYSKMRATTDLHNWFGFLKLRDHKAAQWEIQQYARAVGDIIKALWPRLYGLYEEHSKYAVTLSRTEAEALRSMYRDNFKAFPESVIKKLEAAK